jgi:GNAT superfamily N-acetyltransferase
MLEIADPALDADYQAIDEPLIAFNAKHAPADYEPFAIRLRDDATGDIAGGLFARKYFDWLFVELVFVPEQSRGKGLGSEMIAKAEAYARAKGCVGVWLDTYNFQAPGFYAKLGYEIFGAIEDYPIGGRRIFYQKRFASVKTQQG